MFDINTISKEVQADWDRQDALQRRAVLLAEFFFNELQPSLEPLNDLGLLVTVTRIDAEVVMELVSPFRSSRKSRLTLSMDSDGKNVSPSFTEGTKTCRFRCIPEEDYIDAVEEVLRMVSHSIKQSWEPVIRYHLGKLEEEKRLVELRENPVRVNKIRGSKSPINQPTPTEGVIRCKHLLPSASQQKTSRTGRKALSQSR